MFNPSEQDRIGLTEFLQYLFIPQIIQKVCTMRRSYPSDLTDARWQFVEPLIQTESLRGRKRSTNLREVVNAINYRWNTGCTWRMLPHDFPAWETVYTYFDRWRKAGMLWQIREVIIRKSPYVSNTEVAYPYESQSL